MRDPALPENFFSLYCTGIKANCDKCDTLFVVFLTDLHTVLKESSCKTLKEYADSVLCDRCLTDFIILVEAPTSLLPPPA